VYAGSADKKIYAFNATTGTKIWDYTTGGAVYCSPAVAGNGLVYAGSDDLTLYALDALTGQKIWQYVTGGWLHGSVVVAQGYVYLGGLDAKVRAIGAPAKVGDVNGDGQVDIFDAILLANAFSSTPASPNWNSNADMNSDRIVDIFDAILLANNFGK
jgi:outer membrane protein assembly factor BamB